MPQPTYMQEVATHARFASRTTLGRPLVPVGSASPNSPLFFAHTQAIRNGLMNMGGALGSLGFDATTSAPYDPASSAAFDAALAQPLTYNPPGGQDPNQAAVNAAAGTAYTGPGSSGGWPAPPDLTLNTMTIAKAGGEGGSGAGAGGGSPQSGDSAPSFWDNLGKIVGGVVKGAVPQAYATGTAAKPVTAPADTTWITLGIVGASLVGGFFIIRALTKSSKK